MSDQTMTVESLKPDATPDVMAQKLLDMIDGFDELLRVENDLLADGKMTEVGAMQQDKLIVAQEYELMLKDMFLQRDVLGEIKNTALKEQLKIKAANFQKVLKKNHFSLKSACISAKRATERIAKAALREINKNKNTGYNARGQMTKGAPYNPAGVTDGAY